jgi:hypothetical protein
MGVLLGENAMSVGLACACLAGLVLWLHLQERTSGRVIAHYLGWKGVLLTGWIGVPVHELSHLFAARLFGHRIIAWKLFDPDPASGTLGYVRHAYSRRSLWQILGTFFVGIAPLIVGGLVLWGLLCWMIPSLDRGGSLLRLLARGDRSGSPFGAASALCLTLVLRIWRERTRMLPLQLYLAVCVTCHLAPSPPDLAGSLPGGALLLLLLSAMTGGASLMGHSLAGAAGFNAPLFLLTLLGTAFQGLYLTTVVLGSHLVWKPRRAIGQT